MPGARTRAAKKRFGKRGYRQYEAMGRRTNLSKEARARIVMKGRTKAGRRAMAKKAARTRRRRAR